MGNYVGLIKILLWSHKYLVNCIKQEVFNMHDFFLETCEASDFHMQIDVEPHSVRKWRFKSNGLIRQKDPWKFREILKRFKVTALTFKIILPRFQESKKPKLM